jgi:hypothetical protein
MRSKEKISQTSVGKKNKKKHIYRYERMTYGTHEVAVSSTFPRWHGIQKKKATSQKLGVKTKSKERKVYCSQRLTCEIHEPAESSTFQRRQGIKEKKVATN